MKLMRVMVIDDEAPARRKICRFLKGEADVELIGESSGGAEALEAILREKPDLIFLDVQMPGMDGFEIVEALDPASLPFVVFVTAYDGYALRAFEVCALDYLLKPFDLERFQRVLDRARSRRKESTGENHAIGELLNKLRADESRPARLLIQTNERAFLLPVEQINWVESDRNYVSVHAGGNAYFVRGTIDGLQKRLDPSKFVRVNRSHIVNLDSVKELHPWFHGEYRVILTDGVEITWSRRYLDKSSDIFIKRF